MKKPTVTFGIPAYNEEANIKKLLFAILDQTQKTFTFDKIIVVSDGSSDSTVNEVNSIKDPRILMVDHKSRTGKTIRQNEILKIAKGDYLIFCDADIHFSSKNLIDSIINKLQKKTNFGVAGLNATPLPATNFFETCINYSVTLQQKIRKEWNYGNNFLAFRGAMLVLEKEYYKKITIPKIVANDAYIYLRALQLDFTPVYLADKVIYYKSPITLSDHLKQASRYKSSFKEIDPFFTQKERPFFTIPNEIFMKAALASFFEHPIQMLTYLFIQIFTMLFSYNTGGMTWEVAKSTKKI